MSDTPERVHRVHEEEPPPLLGTWGRVYAFVIGYLALLILAFYFFSRAFSS